MRLSRAEGWLRCLSPNHAIGWHMWRKTMFGGIWTLFPMLLPFKIRSRLNRPGTWSCSYGLRSKLTKTEWRRWRIVLGICDCTPGEIWLWLFNQHVTKCGRAPECMSSCPGASHPPGQWGKLWKTVTLNVEGHLSACAAVKLAVGLRGLSQVWDALSRWLPG